MSKKLILEIFCAVFILFFLFNSLDALLNLQSLKNLIRILPVIFVEYNLVAWVFVIVQFIIATAILVNKTRPFGFILAIVWMLVLASYVVYTQHWPHEFAGVYNYLSFTQHLIVSSIILLMAVISLFLLRKNSKVKLTEVEEHPVVFT